MARTIEMSRRRARAGLLAAAAFAALLGAGCGAKPADQAGGSGGGTGAAQAGIDKAETVFTTAAPKGDIDSFTWNLPNGEPSSLDWLKSYDYSPNTVLANLCEGLFRQEPDFTVTPALAESASRPDPKTFVYKIRQGVKFTDGSEMTANDVVWSLSRHMDAKQGSFWGVPFYSNVASISKTGPWQVTIKLKKPDALFNRMLATPVGVVASERYVKAKGDRYGTPRGGVMCTGPFKLESWQPGSGITLSRNDNYWDAAHKAKAASVQFKFLTDESTITSALESGELDGTFEVPPASISQLSKTGAGTLTFGASTAWFAFRPSEKKGLLTDPRIREALSLAIDRASIAKVIFNGSAVPSVTPIRPGAWGYARDVFKAAANKLPGIQPDPARAKQLVQEAGSPKQPIVLAVSADIRTETQTAQTIQDAARKIGLSVQVKAVSTAQFTNLFFDKKARAPYDAFAAVEYGAGVAEPLVSLSEFTPLSAYNYGELNDPGVTGGVAKGLGTYDDATRAQAASDAEAALVKANGLLSIANPLTSVFQSKRITGAVASLSYLYNPWAAGVGAR